MQFFTIKELSKSITADNHNIDNTPDDNVARNLTLLVDNCLDPLRRLISKPIIVNSGYRCPELNKLVGGAVNSQHTTGQAVDIQTVGDKFNLLLFSLAKTLDFDQLIAENIDENGNIGWIHISYVSPKKNRHQILEMRKKNGKTIYTNYDE